MNESWQPKIYDARVIICVENGGSFEIILAQQLGRIPSLEETYSVAERICAAVNAHGRV